MRRLIREERSKKVKTRVDTKIIWNSEFFGNYFTISKRLNLK